MSPSEPSEPRVPRDRPAAARRRGTGSSVAVAATLLIAPSALAQKAMPAPPPTNMPRVAAPPPSVAAPAPSFAPRVAAPPTSVAAPAPSVAPRVAPPTPSVKAPAPSIAPRVAAPPPSVKAPAPSVAPRVAPPPTILPKPPGTPTSFDRAAPRSRTFDGGRPVSAPTKASLPIATTATNPKATIAGPAPDLGGKRIDSDVPATKPIATPRRSLPPLPEPKSDPIGRDRAAAGLAPVDPAPPTVRSPDPVRIPPTPAGGDGGVVVNGNGNTVVNGPVTVNNITNTTVVNAPVYSSWNGYGCYGGWYGGWNGCWTPSWPGGWSFGLAFGGGGFGFSFGSGGWNSCWSPAWWGWNCGWPYGGWSPWYAPYPTIAISYVSCGWPATLPYWSPWRPWWVGYAISPAVAWVPVSVPVIVADAAPATVPAEAPPAATPLLAAVGDDPREAEAWSLLAEGFPRTAAGLFAELHDERPGDGVPLVGYALALRELGDADGARRTLRQAIALDADAARRVPETPEIVAKLAQARQSLQVARITPVRSDATATRPDEG